MRRMLLSAWFYAGFIGAALAQAPGLSNPMLMGTLCSPAYTTGDRRTTITVTFSGIAVSGGTVPALVDGSFATSAGPLGSIAYTAATPSAGAYMMFDYGAGASVLVTEATYYQDLTTTHATFHWCGSSDAVSCTAQIGSDFVLGGVGGSFAGGGQIQTQLNNNTSPYRAYGLFYVSGAMSNASWDEEFEFKQCSN